MSPTVHYVEPQHHLSPKSSTIAVFGWCLALPLMLVLLMRILAEHRFRRAARADAKFDADAELQEGPMVLKGAIQLQDVPYALQVTIEQSGTEHKGKQGWSTHWKETGRSTDGHPFRLDSAQGLVLVEADADTLVIHSLHASTTRPVNRSQRQRVITLQGGAEIYASGELVYGLDTRAGRDYRGGGGQALVMRGTSKQPLMLSSEPLGERFRRIARITRGWATAYLVLTLLMQLTFITYHMRLSGETTAAQVIKHHTYTTKSKSGTTTHHVLTMRLEANRTFTDEVSYRDYKTIEDGHWVPVRHVPWMSGRERLGTHATVSTPHVVLWAVVTLVMMITQLFWMRGARPWYVAALKETTSGRLPEA